ncbi:Cell death protease [Glutinoglossum americanum]|uniref:Carboxypeptidase n=1 Tax=Glutinoglossum americanum TaxID=1670608 RepID=A0A9P8I5H2_9PEZI|nr:Cell death protease [Glutinoglossum americanum]
MRWFSPSRRCGSNVTGVLACGLLSALLLPLRAVAGETSADYFIHSLPGQPDGPLLKMHAGYGTPLQCHIEVDPSTNGNLFFWHFQNRHIANKQRTVIWLNGGPGCSSMDGALIEVGPYRLKDDAHLKYNPGSWDEFANLLFVDQPVGTGFSYVNSDSYLHDLDEMAAHFVIFLEKFFAMFPEYMHDDIYLSGESYAGQHIPYIAQAILNRNNENPDHIWNIKGLLIGNGWISPLHQYNAYLPYSYKRGLVQGGSEIATRLEAQQSICLSILSKRVAGGNLTIDEPQCEAVLTSILSETSKWTGDVSECVNMYDVRLKDTYPSCGMNWPPDLADVTPYLRRPAVLEALHVNPDKRTGWQECSGPVSGAFKARNSKPAIELLPGLLEKMPILLFSGDQDLICNYMGTEDLIHNMEWNGGKGFETSPGTWAPRQSWTFEGEPAGIYQEARNLTYVLFYNSSHMVPFDYPRRTRDMLDRFIGVDIASIGGTPADSRIDGEKGLETSVGGHPNSTAAEEAERQRLQKATWDAYYKSGEIALVVVAIAAGIWGWCVYRDRRRRGGYIGVLGGSRPRFRGGRVAAREQPDSRGMRLERFRNKHVGRDVEAGDFDESELDDLNAETSRYDGDMERERYSVGGASSDEEDLGRGKANETATRRVER